MPISAICKCGAEIEAPDDLAGKSVKCPQCSVGIPIPAAVIGNTPAAFAESYREDSQISAELKEKTLAELGPNEKVVWMAQPVGAIVFRRNLGYFVGAGFITLLALYFLLFGRMFNAGTNSNPPAANPIAKGKAAGKQKDKAPAPAPAPAASPHSSGHLTMFAVFFLMGAIGTALVPFYRWKMAQGTCYALTNRRAFVYKPGLFGPTREVYSPLEVAAMRRANSWVFSGGGDLIFKTVTVITTTHYQKGGSRSSVNTTHYGFLAIDHVQEIEKLVRETLIDRFVDNLTGASSAVMSARPVAPSGLAGVLSNAFTR